MLRGLPGPLRPPSLRAARCPAPLARYCGPATTRALYKYNYNHCQYYIYIYIYSTHIHVYRYIYIYIYIITYTYIHTFIIRPATRARPDWPAEVKYSEGGLIISSTTYMS